MNEPRTKVLAITLLQGKLYQTYQSAHGLHEHSMSTPRTPWAVHEQSMGSPWALHEVPEQSMSSPWALHEHSMSSPWAVHEQSMSTPWGPWAVHEHSMSTMSSPWAVHGNPWGTVKYRLRKEEDLTKMERMIGRERPKNSAEMLHSRCENFAEVVQSVPAHHHTTWHTFQKWNHYPTI